MQGIYDKLKGDGLGPYFIGQHKGLCLNSYVVIRQGTTIPSINSRRLGQGVVDIMLFVPADSYVEFAPYADKVKKSLRGLGSLRKTGNESPIITDDDKKAYTQTIEYVKQKTMEV